MYPTVLNDIFAPRAIPRAITISIPFSTKILELTTT